MLKTLYQLQKLETEERNIENEKKNSPEVIQLHQIKAAFEGRKKQYLDTLAESEELTARESDLSQQLADTREKAQSERDAMFDGSTVGVKAVEARENQAATLEQKVVELEEKLAAVREKLAAGRDSAAAMKQKMEEQYRSFCAMKSQYLIVEEDRQQRVQALQLQQKELLAQIPAGDLAWFRQEQHRFKGMPIAKLTHDQVCHGCFTMVPPVIYSRTVKGQRTCCENCGRILFIED